MKVYVEKPKKSFLPLYIILGAILVIGACFFLLSLFSQKPSSPLSWEIVSFDGDAQVMSYPDRTWHAPVRGEELREGQKLKTGTNGVVNFRVEDKIMLRLKENAELLNKNCRIQDQKDIYKLHFNKGILLGATTREFDREVASGAATFSVTTPRSIVTPYGAIFRILVSGAGGLAEDRVGVLRGSVEMMPVSFLFPKQGVRIRGLERADLVDGTVQDVKKVSPDEWQEMKEAYELLEKSAAMEAQQIDLAKEAGSFFQKVVFDHGTFFTPKSGYAGREFFKDPDSGAVLLEMEYDVYPPGSFVGVYTKTRNFDASLYDGLTFDVRRKDEEGFPDSFSIELKSKGNVARRSAARGFKKDWTPVEFKFSASKATPVSEVVFVFTNDRVGEAKKGVLEFRHFNLTPKKEPPPAPKPAAQPAQTAPQPTPAPAAQFAVPVQPKPQTTAAPKKSSADEMVPQVISLQ